MSRVACRACNATRGDLVLDLGEQPAADFFPLRDVPGPDPVYPLQMWLCAECGLAQLLSDPTLPEEPQAVEPAALAVQAATAVECVAAAGLLRAGGRVAEFESPHGGSWSQLLKRRGLVSALGHETADVVVDSFGMMHAADQASALADRTARVADGGVLLLQYHSLETIVSRGQWTALRHGHFAYYSTSVLIEMLRAQGFAARQAWEFPLYGGTVLLAAGRDAERTPSVDRSVDALLAREARAGIRDASMVGRLQRRVQSDSARLHDWLTTARESGALVLGYGAASRAVAVLTRAGIDRSLLPSVADASPAKQSRRMPGTDIPISSPSDLAVDLPRYVLLFVPDLLNEVRSAYPEVEAAGGSWVDAETLAPAG